VTTAVVVQQVISDCFNKTVKGQLFKKQQLTWGNGDKIGKQQWEWKQH